MAKSNKKRNVKVEASGEAHIFASFNNIIISLTNNSGQVLAWSSAGKQGFKGAKKNTPYAAQMAAEDCAKLAYEAGNLFLNIFSLKIIFGKTPRPNEIIFFSSI